MEDAMLRTLLLVIASLAFAGSAWADCDPSHAAKRATTDDQAQVTPPAVKTAAAPAAKKKQAACEGGNCAEKAKQVPARGTVALARDTPQGDKPTN
jgi:hypothetical protein